MSIGNVLVIYIEPACSIVSVNISTRIFGGVNLCPMKPEEELAGKFLKTCFGSEPTFEPLGRSTAPDFSINKTAFEVRRLNQYFIDEDGIPEGVEQIDRRLHGAVRGELRKIAFSTERGSYFWGLEFRRPLPVEPRNVAKELTELARSHYLAGSRTPMAVGLNGVTLDLIPASDPHDTAFVWGFQADGDTGGFIGGIYPPNIRLALEDKISKTKDIAGKFERWVLVLIDSILPGIMSPSDIGEVDLDLQHFNSVVILNPDATVVMEIPDNSLKGCET
jgi:hypothetical protein